jgi:endo-1,4-beta-xylanase
MPTHRRSSWWFCLFTFCFAALALAACANPGNGDPDGQGGSGAGQGGSTGAAGSPASKGGSTGTAGAPGKGGATGAAGSGQGGSTGIAGSPSHGGSTGIAGSPGQGGSTGVAGSPGQGGSTGVAGRGGFPGVAGMPGVGGAKGGSTGAAGAGTAGNPGTGGAVDACAVTTALTGGTTVQSSNKAGKTAGLDWTIWSNGSGGSITYYDFPAFKATWNNSSDFLARLGVTWNATKTYDQYGTITAQFNSKKTGSGGGYSYIGIYGWSVSPCVEFYIVDDSYNRLPVNPGNTTNKGNVTIDGGTYTLYTRNTTGTGGSKCSGVSSWVQYYSIRNTARTCGQFSVTEHFDAWAKAGMPLGKMDQVQILVEVGGGVGSIDFPVASVSTTIP